MKRIITGLTTSKRLKLDSSLVTVDAIQPWSEICSSKYTVFNDAFNVNSKINEKVSLYKGDITKLRVDAIVNAAKESLLGGGGIDNAIHSAAGVQLRNECEQLPEIYPGVRCETGGCKVTRGYKLHAEWVLHTVGPRDQNKQSLENCYSSCLQNVLSYGIKTVAFCCIATQSFNFNKHQAAEIALKTVRVWMESNH